MSAVSTFLANLGATLLTDESAPLLPIITDYTTSLAADSSFLNLQAQNIKFVVAIQAFVQTQLPALIKATAAEIAAAGNATPVATPSPTAAS